MIITYRKYLFDGLSLYIIIKYHKIYISKINIHSGKKSGPNILRNGLCIKKKNQIFKKII